MGTSSGCQAVMLTLESVDFGDLEIHRDFPGKG